MMTLTPTDAATDSSPAHSSWLASTLLSRSPRLLARYVAFRQQLSQMNRSQRRWLVRRVSRLSGKAAVTLAGAALLLALSRAPVGANSLNVPSGEVGIANNGQCSLIEAIINANDTTTGLVHDDCAAGDPAGADVIHLANNGTFTLFDAIGAPYDAPGYGSDLGLPPITSDVTIDGNNAIIRRSNGGPAMRLFTVTSSGDLTLQDVTLRRGQSQANGGAIYSYYADVTLDNVLIDDSTAQGKGGGLHAYGGTVTISDSTFDSNTAVVRGGGLAQDSGTMTVSTSTVSGNEAQNSWGGGIYTHIGSLDLVDSVVSGNEAQSGGGVISEGSTVNINGSTISDNTVVGVGGGLQNYVASFTVVDSVVSGNTAGSGGGVHTYGGTLTLSGTTINNNTALDRGGAAYTYLGNAVITNSTFSGNTAVQKGGGLFMQSGTVELNNATVTMNAAGDTGGGLYVQGGSLDLNRNIISGNSAPAAREVGKDNGVITANNRNLFGLFNKSGLAGLVPGANDIVPWQVLPGILNTTLQDNGGPTPTHRLTMASPALDTSSNVACSATETAGIDQRALPRNVNGRNGVTAFDCDSGAVERQSLSLIFTTNLSLTLLPSERSDIVRFDGERWSVFFDASAAGLSKRQRPAAFHVVDPDREAVLLSLTGNRSTLPGIGPVTNHDVVRAENGRFSLVLDGSAIGLNGRRESIDALHMLDATALNRSDCAAYFLLSTTSSGRVEDANGGMQIAGEDVLGFCATGLGINTAGTWEKVIDGSDAGLPRNAVVGVSASPDGRFIYFVTKGRTRVGDVSAGPSMVIEYDRSLNVFNGPLVDFTGYDARGKATGLHIAEQGNR